MNIKNLLIPFFFLLILVVVSCKEEESDTLSVGLTAYYSLNNSLKENSSNELDITNNGCSFVEDRKGNSKSAISFNGTSNFVVFPDSLRFKPLQSTTLSFWILTNQTSRFDLFNQRTGNYDPDLFNHGIIVNNLAVGSVGRIDYAFPGYNDGTKPYFEHNFCDSSWHMLTFIKNCENKRFEFYDGKQLIYACNMVDSDFEINGQLILGKEYTGTIFFKGAIDDIRIYHRALSASEIGKLVEI
jgi:hypothetical protein